jgi:hypothetical protein
MEHSIQPNDAFASCWPEENDDLEPIEIQDLNFTINDGALAKSFQCTLFLGSQTSILHLSRFGIGCVLNVANEIPAMEETERERQGLVSYTKLTYPGLFDRARERNAFFDRCYDCIAALGLNSIPDLSVSNASGADGVHVKKETNLNLGGWKAMVHCKFGLNRYGSLFGVLGSWV